MKLRIFTAAVASISLMTTPALAAAGSAADVAAEVAPATETVNSDQQIYGASIILQFAILVALAAAIYFGAKALDGDDEPASP